MHAHEHVNDEGVNPEQMEIKTCDSDVIRTKIIRDLEARVKRQTGEKHQDEKNGEPSFVAAARVEPRPSLVLGQFGNDEPASEKEYWIDVVVVQPILVRKQ